MNGRWNTTKSIILEAEKITEHLFLARRFFFFTSVRDRSFFFLNEIADISEIISPNYEYSHRKAVSKET